MWDSLVNLGWSGALEIASQIIAAASVIAALTPTPKDDHALRKARRVIDALALNVRHAKNDG